MIKVDFHIQIDLISQIFKFDAWGWSREDWKTPNKGGHNQGNQTKIKGKLHPAKQTKTVSTGSQKTVLQEATGLSTGSSVFLPEASCKAIGQARIDYEEGFEAWGLLRRHATTLFFHPPLVSSPFIWLNILAQSYQGWEFSRKRSREKSMVSWQRRGHHFRSFAWQGGHQGHQRWGDRLVAQRMSNTFSRGVMMSPKNG